MFERNRNVTCGEEEKWKSYNSRKQLYGIYIIYEF